MLSLNANSYTPELEVQQYIPLENCSQSSILIFYIFSIDTEKLKVLKQKSNEQYRDATSPNATQGDWTGDGGDDPCDKTGHCIQDETVKALLIDMDSLKSVRIIAS